MIPEPPAGSTIRFTKFRRYTYVCYRIDAPGDDHDWYTTAESDWREATGIEPYIGKTTTWKRLVKFIGDDEVELATEWKPLVRF